MSRKAFDLKEDIWTYEDYLHLPSDGKTYHVIGGNLFMVPAPPPFHQGILRNLGFIIWDFVKRHDIGKVLYAPIDVVFSQVNVTQPDIIYILKKHLGIIKEKGIFGTPDWIIEILSPFTLELDMKLKRERTTQNS